MVAKFLRFIDTRLRSFVFPKRLLTYRDETDIGVKKLTHYGAPNDGIRLIAELELETRAWIREFWSRSFVAWLALLISLVALTVSVCTFYISPHRDHGAPKGQNHTAQQPGKNVP